jgi:hypothetical protein
MVAQLGKAVSGLGTSMRRERLGRQLLGTKAPKFGSAWDEYQDLMTLAKTRAELGGTTLEQELKRAQIQSEWAKPSKEEYERAKETARAAESLRRHEETTGFQRSAAERAERAEQRQITAEQAKQYPFAALQQKVDRIAKPTGGTSADWLQAHQSGQIEYVTKEGVPTETPESATAKGINTEPGWFEPKTTITPKEQVFAQIKGTTKRMPVTTYEGIGGEMQALQEKYPGYDIMATPPPAEAAPPVETAPASGGAPLAASGPAPPSGLRVRLPDGRIVPFESLPPGSQARRPDGQIVTRR